MRNVHHSGRLGKDDLVAMTQGKVGRVIDDMEFFETLACNRCLVMPPWVYHVGKGGELEKLTPVRYTRRWSLDKASILLAIIGKLQRQHVEA